MRRSNEVGAMLRAWPYPSRSRSRVFRILRGLTVGISLWASLSLVASAQATNNPDKTEARIATAMTGLQRFQSSHSLDDLRATSHALFSAVDRTAIKTGDFPARRRSVVTAFAQVLSQIEALSDPTFDPNDVKNFPQVCLTPDREPDGRQLPSCADPNDISDSATRARYVAAIKANELKIKRIGEQHTLRNLDHGTMQELQIVLRGFHSNAPSDGVALDNILRQAGISDARRAKINAMF
jgi:hypothetical protein